MLIAANIKPNDRVDIRALSAQLLAGLNELAHSVATRHGGGGEDVGFPGIGLDQRKHHLHLPRVCRLTIWAVLPKRFVLVTEIRARRRHEPTEERAHVPCWQVPLAVKADPSNLDLFERAHKLGLQGDASSVAVEILTFRESDKGRAAAASKLGQELIDGAVGVDDGRHFGLGGQAPFGSLLGDYFGC